MGLIETDIKNQDDVRFLVEELTKVGTEAQRRFHLVAERNELWVSGEQFADINVHSQTIVDLDWKTDLPKIVQNHLRNLLNTYKARITADRPDATAWPTNNTPEALASAEISRKFMEYFAKEIQMDTLVDEVVRIAALHGCGGFKICYNPAKAEVEWKPVSIFDFVVDPAANWTDDANWVVFRTHVDPYQARAEMQAAGIDEDPPIEMHKTNNQEEIEGTEVIELWHKPTPRLPQGLFAKMIGSHILDSRPFPYTFPNLENPQGKPQSVLPLVYFKIDQKRGTPYADTWLSDVISEQRLINENEAMLLRIKRETANVKLIVEDKAVVQQLNSNSQVIMSAGGLGANGFMAPPVINSLLFADRDHHFKRMYDIAGLNEQLVGVENIKSGSSAKQIAYLNELDGQKHKAATQSLEMMLIRAWKLTLQLVQYYYLDERLMRISADEGFATVAFKGADIQGVTVDLQPRPGLSRLAASRIAQAEDDVKAGIRSPGDLPGIRETGQLEPAAVSNTRRIVQMEIAQILRGAQARIDPSLIASVAAQEAQEVARLLVARGISPELLMAVQAFAQAYKQLAEQQQAQGQQAQAQPQPKVKPGQPSPPVGAAAKAVQAKKLKAEGAAVGE